MSSNSRLWLWCVLILGCIIRLLAAYMQPANVDEAFNQYLCQAGPQAIVDMMVYDNHTPLLQLACLPIERITDNIFWLRFPELLFSIGSILLAFAIFKRFFSDAWSIALTAFVSLSYQIWITDIQFRPYAPLMFFMLALWLGLLDIHQYGAPWVAWTTKHPRWRWFLFVCVCLGCGSVHFLGVMELVGCGIVALFIKQESRFRTLLCLALGCIPGAAWFIWSRLSRQIAENLAFSSLMDHFAAFASIPLYLLNLNLIEFVRLVENQELSFQLTVIVSWLSLAINIAIWVLLIIGIIKLLKQYRWETSLMSMALLFPPIVLGIAGVLGFVSLAQTRYAIPMTVPFIILLVYGIKEQRQRFFVGFIIAITSIYCLAFPFATSLWNQYWQGAIDAIDDVGRPGDYIGVYLPYNAYSFAKAYNPNGIFYNYNNNLHLDIEQHKVEGKLPMLALEPWMFQEEVINGPLRDARLILVAVQINTFHGEQSIAWLNQYYEFKPLYHHLSTRGWAEVHVFLLTRRAMPVTTTQETSKASAPTTPSSAK